ncbi:ATP-binding cassette domain-containing protein [Planococcus lenghuensis]|uniref:ABC transporter n=1 Tax=Planococcus lenghuensis TaxID=2213202 RepID=A0A1Q2KW88_9BACL|nr:ATP-binding cassette domain-containing protein [Planococcus lenghuensis]AQQ51932.1 ABC transporter [Planococcus lenghuensis]
MLELDFRKQLKHFELQAALELSSEIMAIVGPSGSGKTTLLNSIAGIAQPDSGSIRLNGRIFFETNRKPLKIQNRRIGYLFQDYALFPHMTARQNIFFGVGRQADTSHITELTELLGIAELLNNYPHQISGGEKQRVALARALAAQPELLLLDEPFSALDDETRNNCQQQLVRIHRLWKIPVMFVTHSRQEAAKLADRIVQVDRGQLTVLAMESSI